MKRKVVLSLIFSLMLCLLFFSSIMIRENTMATVNEIILSASSYGDNSTQSSAVETRLKLSENNYLTMYKMEGNNRLSYAPDFRINNQTIDISSITGSTREGALEFYLYYESGQAASSYVRMDQNFENGWSQFYYAQTWQIGVDSNTLLKYTLPFKAGGFFAGTDAQDAAKCVSELYSKVGGLIIDIQGVSGFIMVSDFKVVSTTITEVRKEVVPFLPSISLGDIPDEMYEGGKVSKPTIICAENYLMKIKVKGAQTSTINVTKDSDYEISFDQAGSYEIEYIASVGSKEYSEKKNVLVKEFKAIDLNVVKADKTTASSSEVGAVTFNDINMRIVTGTKDVTIGCETLIDGGTIDITSITQNQNKGALEFYIYYTGSSFGYFQIRLDAETENANSWLCFHQNFTIPISLNTYYKVILPLSTGAFGTGFTNNTADEAEVNLYSIVGGYNIGAIGTSSGGVLLCSDVRVITSSEINVMCKEIDINKPLISTNNLISTLVLDEEVSLKPTQIIPSKFNGSEMYISVSGKENIQEFKVNSDDDYNFSFSSIGDYVITYRLNYGTGEIQEEFEFNVEGYFEEELDKDRGYVNSEKSINYKGERYFDNKQYSYLTGDSGAGLRYVWYYQDDTDLVGNKGIDITSLNVESAALEFELYVHYEGSINDAAFRLGNATNMWFDYPWTYRGWNLNSLPTDKLCKITLRLSDGEKPQADAQEVYCCINNFKFYIDTKDGSKANGYMLISKIKIVSTGKPTGIEILGSPTYDLKAPTITKTITGGDVLEEYNLAPTIKKTGYTDTVSLQTSIYYDDKLLKTFDKVTGIIGNDIDTKLLTLLGNVKFPTGRTYKIVYQVEDKYGNTRTTERNITITGSAVDNEIPTIDSNSLVTSITRGTEVDLNQAIITDNFDAKEDLTITYSVKLNGVVVIVIKGKFTPNEIGNYHIIIKAKDKSNNEAKYEYDLVVNKKNTVLPTINIPNNFRTEFLQGSDVSLRKITAEDCEGNELDVVYSIEDAKGNDVEIENGKFVVNNSGKYSIKMTVVDVDYNEKELVVEINVASAKKDGCDSSIFGVCPLILLIGAIIRKKKINYKID